MRQYTEVAGVFLLWVEKVESDDLNNPPWEGKALRRNWREKPEGIFPQKMTPWDKDKLYGSLAEAQKLAVNAVRADFSREKGYNFDEFLLPVKDLVWIGVSQVSDEEWTAACVRFKDGKDFKLP